MEFTIQNLEFYLLILVRIAAFVFTAPFFSFSNIPIKVKAGISFFIALAVFPVVKYVPLEYVGTIGYAILVVKEGIVGVIIGFMSNVSIYIINLAGQLIDMDIGFSMINVLDPITRVQVTITGNYYSYFVLLMLFVTNMHFYLLRTVVDTFTYIPIGKAVLSENLYKAMLEFMGDYFIIGFRIVLPVFSCILIVNVVLGVLAKIAPQMNMFVVGMQLKLIVGLIVLLFIVGTIPSVADFIFSSMRDNLTNVIKFMTPG